MGYNLSGLNSEEVEKLQKKYGMNELVIQEKPNMLKKFLGVFKEPMFLLLLIAATVYFLLGAPKDGAIMLVFVGFVASITFIQEWKTEKTMNALKDLTSPKVNTLRNGKNILIKSTELVPGDVVFLSEGERIPADCIVLEPSNFSVDESILTGESEYVMKVSTTQSEKSTDYWKKDILYAGTLCVFGKCTAIVKFTGVNTEYGKIGKAISEAKDEPTPLQKKVSILVKNIAIAGVVLCISVMVASYFYSFDILNSILSGISLAMAIIPEEFPVVLTVFLSMGAYRLAKNNTLMRKISAVETLGSATVLCVDKTGTITQNKMKVKSIYSDGIIFNNEDLKNQELSDLMVLSCEKDPYDPMEKAILEAANLSKLETLYKYDLSKKIAFDSKTKRMANIYIKDNKYYVAVKGSAETVLGLCNLDKQRMDEINIEIDKMASNGLRVLALADCTSEKVYDDLECYELTFKGLVGLQDPPKEGVEEAIKLCKKAGIRVVMITGDYSKTAMAIGEEIGLRFTDKVIVGNEIDSLSENELCEVVKSCDVFSRVIPEQKMKIVKALKKNGEIVAMTGDGVNDAPALKSADIGIAMGQRGTEVAKEAADMILMDDNFTTIVKSVKDGRRVYDNIRKAMVYILIIHIPIAAMAMFAPLFNLPPLLLPMHIMLLELIIDPTCSIVFEGEPAEANIMDNPPRPPQEPLLTRNLTIKVVLQGIIMFLAAFMPFHYMIDLGISSEYARSFSLITFIVANVTLVLVNRSNTELLYHLIKEKGSKVRLIVNSMALIMVFAIVYIPILNSFFRTEKIGIYPLIIAIVLGFISTGWWEIVKITRKIIRKGND
ncbi:cation-translocating P-type ATPase [Clostridium butyricum]|uniref:Calcium-transporting ATPase 1 (P-type calcium ATPase) n=1 Tax=Clostridium butyricum E4 str. BoNT E BL5262 TaxID=632245 RepID=C4ILQ3_CLOBU|nr:cation-translocating P-type ATPase [Clostridium butyricum]EDT75785.1 calcium-transporting ATPase 1 [Clostridium butyricum 5521]EEP52867.1 calcium-transporting ATPase 1 (P-type calcium ATPase) [Clostridium butyricum E4 str. BoNT E BL5262]NFL29874.1 cation-translocating P-type ATPase [Clostridium butyricum]NFS17519.1 cation-translocating P-type ATPase [Clostridium butyricum]